MSALESYEDLIKSLYNNSPQTLQIRDFSSRISEVQELVQEKFIPLFQVNPNAHPLPQHSPENLRQNSNQHQLFPILQKHTQQASISANHVQMDVRSCVSELQQNQVSLQIQKHTQQASISANHVQMDMRNCVSELQQNQVSLQIQGERPHREFSVENPLVILSNTICQPPNSMQQLQSFLHQQQDLNQNNQNSLIQDQILPSQEQNTSFLAKKNRIQKESFQGQNVDFQEKYAEGEDDQIEYGFDEIRRRQLFQIPQNLNNPQEQKSIEKDCQQYYPQDKQGENNTIEEASEIKNQSTVDPDLLKRFKQLNEFYSQKPEFDKSWDSVVQNKNISIFKKQIPQNPTVLIKTQSVIQNITVEEIFEAIYYQEIRTSWDKLTLGFRILQKENQNTDIIYFYIDPGFGVTKRDFLQRRSFLQHFPQPNDLSILFYSITHDECPEKKGYIRATSYISGYVLRRLEEGHTELNIVAQTDVKGIIPKSIVNFTAARAPSGWIENLKSGILARRKANLQKQGK